MTLTRVSEITAYQSPWLKPGDLAGRSVVVTIATAGVESLRQQSGAVEPRIVLTFRGKEKKLALNKTNAAALVKLTGTDVFADWVGRAVTLSPTTTRSGIQTVEVGAAPSGNPFES